MTRAITPSKSEKLRGGFRTRVLEAVRRIPRGQVRTYGEVAAAAGSAGAARAVGSLMKANVDPTVPCHRVVRSDMTPGDYNRPGGTRTKVARLREEGVQIEGATISRESTSPHRP